MKPTTFNSLGTDAQFDAVMARCAGVYRDKNADYGPSWRLMRPSTLTDQLLIKARRIRNLERGLQASVSDEADVAPEWVGLVNYGLMALAQLELGAADTLDPERDSAAALAAYTRQADEAKALMKRKNHDYGEAWRDMRVSSFTDIILTKLQRIKEIENHAGATTVSEGIGANYLDIVIYAVFALIKLAEERDA